MSNSSRSTLAPIANAIKKGNDQADHAADLATKVHGKDVVSVAAIFHKRHNLYTAFMKRVVKHIIEAYLIHRLLLDKKQDSGSSDAQTPTGLPTRWPAGRVDAKAVSDQLLRGRADDQAVLGSRIARRSQYHFTCW